MNCSQWSRDSSRETASTVKKPLKETGSTATIEVRWKVPVGSSPPQGKQIAIRRDDLLVAVFPSVVNAAVESAGVTL